MRYKLTPLGVAVKKALIDKGMSQDELAAMLKTNKRYLSDILYGRRSGDKYKVSIVTLLGIDPSLLDDAA